jgi:hypothetical protein
VRCRDGLNHKGIGTWKKGRGKKHAILSAAKAANDPAQRGTQDCVEIKSIELIHPLILNQSLVPVTVKWEWEWGLVALTKKLTCE